MKHCTGRSLSVLLFIFLATQNIGVGNDARAAEIGDRVFVGGILAGVSQRENTAGPANKRDLRGGSGPFQLELGFLPSESNEFFVKFGFNAGNGLDDITSFHLASWAADQEDDVTNINGRQRDHLLTAWYKHTFEFKAEYELGLTGGIIDATDYLDQNVYANDEYTQFMNEALVSGPNSFAPSYDIGGALEWQIGRMSLSAVAMEVGENEEGNTFQFFGAQLGYHLDARIGEGNYRIIVEGSDATFLNPSGNRLTARRLLLFSFDQQLGAILGAWTRFGWQDDDAAVNYRDIYSGGININGRPWGRGMDDIGIGYAHLRGGNLDLKSTHVFESYVRLALSETLSITGDLQYMNDALKVGGNHDGFVYGLRVTAAF